MHHQSPRRVARALLLEGTIGTVRQQVIESWDSLLTGYASLLQASIAAATTLLDGLSTKG